MGNRLEGNPIPATHPPFDPSKTEATPESMIQHHWQELNGAPGAAVGGVQAIGHAGAQGHRISYTDGDIYLNERNSHPSWVRGEIRKRYLDLGGAQSWLGFPTGDEKDFSEGGRVSEFDHGNIYWWPDSGPIEADQIVIKYTGILCFGETDWDQASPFDEPYVVLGTVSPQGTTAARSQIYERVKAIQGRADDVEIFRGRPYGVVVTALLMEHDEDNPDRYKDEIEGAVRTAFGSITAAVAAAGPVGAAVAVVAGPVLQKVAPDVAKAINTVLDLQDDNLGQQAETFSPKRLLQLATKTPLSLDYGVRSNYQTGLYTGGGSTYKVCLSVEKAG